MVVRALAKINLSLRVLGTRPDGYHELQTIFQSIALHDTVTIRRSRGALRLTCDDPSCPSGRRNLVWRAAARVWTSAGRSGAPRGVSIHLAKRIPLEAGLGGGSSDAAAAIRALGRMWRVDDRRQREIAAALGADVPYFFEGGTVLGLARGDQLVRLADRPAAWVVLALPSFRVSTKEAFAWFDRARRPRRRGAALHNDLAPAVARRHPEIPRLVQALARAGASHAMMSGSGSTVFGLFRRQRAAMDAASEVVRSGCRAIVTRTVGRRSYRRLAATKPIGYT